MSRSATDNDPLLGRVLDGKYTLLSVLGRGGMGVVFKAHQKSLERSVALKLMMGVEPEREAEFQRRFFLEAATAAKLKHPNTITVFDYGSDVVDGERVFYITMELLDGITLSKLLSKGVPLPPLRAINIAMQMARSLREAHVAGIVHRDLKPGNIMLVRQDVDDSEGDADFVKVLDFGLAKTKGGSTTGSQLTKAGTFLGSPRYVAPEQIEGKPIDGRADIYSFGCVLYRMLSGRVPFDGSQAVEVMLKHIHDPVPPLDTPGVPASLEALVMACLAKKAADRPKTMDDVTAALRRTRQELTGGLSGNISIPDDINAQLREVLSEQPPITLTPKEQTSPSQVAPPRPTKDDSQPSLAPSPMTQPSSPSVSQTPSSLAALAQSGEWRLGDAGVVGDASRSSFGSSRLQVQRRRGGGAVVAGALIGLVVMGVGVAFRLGHLDPFLASVQTPAPPPTPTGPTATSAASVRLRIKTDPSGADVFDVTGGVPKLLGLTPLVVPWEVSAGDSGRTLQLKLRGHVPAQARVEPPAPSHTGEPVWLDVEATLRPLPPR
jgi:serine/threonine-protein kinase